MYVLFLFVFLSLCIYFCVSLFCLDCLFLCLCLVAGLHLHVLDMVLCWRENYASRGGWNVGLEQKQQRSVLLVVPAPDKRHLKLVTNLILTSPPALAATGSVIQSNPKLRQLAEINVSVSGGVPPYKYVWTKGQIVLPDTALHISNPKSGTYFFTVTDSCSEVVLTFTINENLQANTFTPNGDGTNDLFYENVFLQIFNRNGILLYEGTSGWDGTFNNQPVQEDTYMYVVKYKSDSEYEYKTGYVTVVR
jgi:gliding motility-associated-like protein